MKLPSGISFAHGGVGLSDIFFLLCHPELFSGAVYAKDAETSSA